MIWDNTKTFFVKSWKWFWDEHEDIYRVFRCRNCSNKVSRDGLGDLFDYPTCQACQYKDSRKVTRLDNGKYF